MVRSNILISLALLACVLMSCGKKPAEVYSYAFYYNDYPKPISYIVKEVTIEKGVRNVLSYEFDSTFVFRKKSGELLRLDSSEIMYKGYYKEDSLMFKPYFMVSSSQCVYFETGDRQIDAAFSTEYCFIGILDSLKIDGVWYQNVFEFKKYLGKQTRIFSKVYLDYNFMLLKEESVSGEIDPYRIERLRENLRLQTGD